MDHVDTLRAMQSLEEVSDDAVKWLADHVEPKSFGAGDRLIVENESDRDCYFIVSGETEVSAGGKVMGRTGPGEPEGERALFLKVTRLCTTVALEPVETLRLSAADFDRLSDEDPDTANAIEMGIMRHLGRRFGIPTGPDHQKS